MLRPVYDTVLGKDMVMNATVAWVGIDVGKTYLDVAVVSTDTSFRVKNQASGWERLIRRLEAMGPVQVVMEATGRYHLDAWIALDLAKVAVTVVNPGRTHAFAKSEPYGAKTDRHDARMLARFGQQKQPLVTPLPRQELRDLRDLVACRDALTKMLVQEKNREQTATTAIVAAMHQTLMTELDQKRRDIDAAINRLVARDAMLTARRALLETVPGIGPTLSAVLVAGLPELGTYDAKAIAALAGVAPHPRDSGKRHGKRHIGGGRQDIRKAVYQIALTAVKWSPTMKDHYARLRERCAPKAALVACGRRLLGILTAMVRENLTWPETRVGQADRRAAA